MIATTQTSVEDISNITNRPIWDINFDLPVTVVPNVAHTVSINWHSPGCNGGIQNLVASPAPPFFAHRVITIIDPEGPGGVSGTVPVVTSDWSVSGNGGLSSANFLGTIDATPLQFQQNNNRVGFFDATNTLLGTSSGLINTGTNNTFVGKNAAVGNTTGGSNTAIGAEAGLFLTNTSSNTFLGVQAGRNSTGSNTIIENTMVPQRHNLSTWSLPLAGILNTTMNTMQVTGVNSYNTIWTFAGSTSPLPVEFLSFNATPKDNNKVICEWLTASEINNDYFSIQRSKNGIDFETLGTVDGAGFSNVVLSYNFTDYNPLSDVSYCRVMQTDFDGGYKYSNTVVVRLTGQAPQISLYPNPTSGQFYIYKDNLGAMDASICVFDESGRLIISKILSGSDVEMIDLQHVAKGVYTTKLVFGEQVKVAKLIIQ